MLRPLIRALVAIAAAGFAQGALANGFYVSGAVSAVQREATTSPIANATDTFGNRVFVDGVFQPYQQTERNHYDVGGEVDVAGGYKFSLGGYGALRTEVEFSFRDYQLGASDVRSNPGQLYSTMYSEGISTTKGLNEERYAGTVNAFYDFTRLKWITPYVGAGVGYQYGVQTPGDRLHAYQAIEGPMQTGGVFSRSVGASNAGDGTWLVEGGVALPLTAKLSLVPAYRYSQSFAGRSAVNIERMGLRYSF